MTGLAYIPTSPDFAKKLTDIFSIFETNTSIDILSHICFEKTKCPLDVAEFLFDNYCENLSLFLNVFLQYVNNKTKLNMRIIQLLIDLGADVEYVTPVYITVMPVLSNLASACHNNDYDLAKMLIKNKADVNRIYKSPIHIVKDNMLPLKKAIFTKDKSHDKTIRLLLENNADTSWITCETFELNQWTGETVDYILDHCKHELTNKTQVVLNLIYMDCSIRLLRIALKNITIKISTVYQHLEKLAEQTVLSSKNRRKYKSFGEVIIKKFTPVIHALIDYNHFPYKKTSYVQHIIYGIIKKYELSKTTNLPDVLINIIDDYEDEYVY